MAKSKPEASLNDLFSAPEETTLTGAGLGSDPPETAPDEAVLPEAVSSGVEPAQEPAAVVEKPTKTTRTRKKSRAGTETPEVAPMPIVDKTTSSRIVAPPAPAAEWAGPGTDSDKPAGPERQLVVVSLSKEQYGVDIARIDSIIKMQSITAVPRAPDFVRGITNLRGTVLPVIDLRQRFGLAVLESTPDARIVVAEIGGNKVGVIVDAVVEVRRIPEAAIEPPSPLLIARQDIGNRADCITGIAKIDDGRLIMLLDLERIASPGDKGGR